MHVLTLSDFLQFFGTNVANFFGIAQLSGCSVLSLAQCHFLHEPQVLFRYIGTYHTYVHMLVCSILPAGLLLIKYKYSNRKN